MRRVQLEWWGATGDQDVEVDRGAMGSTSGWIVVGGRGVQANRGTAGSSSAINLFGQGDGSITRL